ncbi:AAA family ATPase [Lasiodiplodia theobromae]|uniref:AAA family ATPase n=1 Tax=Lasiodiplodia theobromae TaxID=45133 RepID=UPI0015C3E6D2|nr:AAA family ATPase [Lasiodiplodia theobromae]KAF4540191.1 AAA family ATPase [Lasiodiplodia theobromae]
MNVTTTISQDWSEEFDLVAGVKTAEDDEQGTAKTLRTTTVAPEDHIDPIKGAELGQENLDAEETNEVGSDSGGKAPADSNSAIKETVTLVEDAVPGLPTNGERKASSTLNTREITAALGAELYGNGPHSHLFQYLLTTISKLELERRALEQQLLRISEPKPAATIAEDSHDTLEKPREAAEDPQDIFEKSQEATDAPTTYIWEVFHRVAYGQSDAFFRDIPRKFKGDTDSDSLRGRDETENMLEYMKRHPSTAFAVIYHYSTRDYTGRKAGVVSGRMIQDGPPAKSHGQYIQLAEQTKDAIKAIITEHPEEFKGFTSENDFPLPITQPYWIFYLYNQAFLRLRSCSGLEENDQNRMKLLCDWFEENWRSDWDEANALLGRGKINRKHYSKLFRPGDIWISKDDDGSIKAEKLEPFPWSDVRGQKADAIGWCFNGSFVKEQWDYWTHDEIYIIPTGKEEVDITSLSGYPIRFAESGTYEKLVSRGEKFWQCRKKKLISFQEEGDPIDDEVRYMVDYQMLKRMHPKKAIFQYKGDDLGEEAMNAKNPPDDDFLALLPSHIHAFSLQRKHWFILIDEADVFIEERNFADMKRNALISVFLRAMEYFNGILILTTNRVGTFDAAFKSRIQLALRYRPLDQDQRRRVWSNFFRMLRNTKERVDLDDLEMNVEKLARIDMNGRQIRNAVTTARHLAKFRKERLVYGHIQDAVETVTDFDKYLDTVRGVLEERWAREDRLR